MDRRLADLSQPARAQIGRAPAIDPCFGVEQREDTRVMASAGEAGFGQRHLQGAPVHDMVAEERPVHQACADGREVRPEDLRSEEHTSELQSLMRISYAVFCLKKKTLTPVVPLDVDTADE